MNTDNIKLNGTVIQGGSLRYPKTPNLLLGENKGYERGDILDANAVSKLIEEGGGGGDPEEIEKIKLDLQKKADKTELHTELDKKQDTIPDLATIRSGAAKGATAYQKPTDGISYNDLYKDINEDLEFGNTAYWDLHLESNGLLWKVPSAASTTNQLADKDFVNSSISTALDSKAEKVGVKQEELRDDAVLSIEANTIYELTYNTVIDIALGFPTSTEKCEYCIKFDVASTIPTLTLPDEIIWAEELKLEANTHYVILISYENGRYYGDWKSYPLT